MLRSLQEHYKYAKTISVEDVSSFAEQLVEIGKILVVREYDFVVFPLRGGLKPAIQLHVIGKESIPSCWLPFTSGSQRKNDEQVLAALTDFLRPFLHRESLKFAVVDTAISGYGSLALADILRDLNERTSNQAWQVDFHLLYSVTNKNWSFPERSLGIPAISRDRVKFALEHHRVDSLLVEDWNEAIGLEASWEGKTLVMKPTSDGQVILKETDGTVNVIESTELSTFIDVLISQKINASIAGDGSLSFKQNVWEICRSR
jgi:hypothetical protein